MFKSVMFLFSLLILGLIIFLSNPAELASKLALSNPVYIVLALVVSSVANILRTFKWSVLVGVKPWSLFPIQMLGMTMSNFTPAKVGEPAKTFLLKMKNGINVSQSLPSVIWERINDIIVLLFLSVLVIHTLSLKKEFLFLSAMSMVIFIAAIAVFLLILKSRNLGIKFFSFLRRLPLGSKIPATFADTFYKNRIRKKRIFLSLLITLIPWILEGVVLYISFIALGINPPTITVLAGMIALSALVGVLSTLPGGLGSFEGVMVILLAPLGIAGSSAVAGVLLYRFLSFWYAAFLGGLSFLYLSRKINMKKLW